MWRLLSPPQPALPLLVAVTAAAAGYAPAAKFAARGLLAACSRPAAKPFTDALAGAARVSKFEWCDGASA